MTSTDVFALKNSSLNPFLFADVGLEQNGSALTILSILARLGQDPWTEAGRLAKLPKAAATDCLAEDIGRMPLTAQALADARTTASRLILLLPVLTATPSETKAVGVVATPMPQWAMIAFVLGTLLLGLAASAVYAPPLSHVSIQPSGTNPAAIMPAAGG